jgi:mycothiol synthase
LAALGAHPFLQPDLPAGFFVRSYAQMQQVDLFTDAMNRSYAGLWGHRHCSQEEVEVWFSQLSPEGIFFLFAPDGNVAGLGRAQMDEHLTTQRGVPTGLVDAPGIVPAYRDADLYLPLFLTILQWLVRQNPTAIELESWGDAPATLDLYRSLGFTSMTEAISYRRLLVS